MTAESKGDDVRMWAMLCHGTALLAYTGIGGPAIILGPLMVWLMKGDSNPLIKENGRSAMNFNATVVLAGLAVLALAITSGMVFVAAAGVLALSAYHLFFTIAASIEARKGRVYRYPLSFQLF